MDTINSVFPKNPVNPIKKRVYKPVIKTESEGNYIHVRSRSSRKRTFWEITFALLSSDEVGYIIDFFDSNQGSSFYFVDPTDSVTYTVVFADDSLEMETSSNNKFNLTIKLEEI